MSITQAFVPDAYVFPNSGGYTRKWLVLHKTAGGSSAQGVASWFQSGAGGAHTSVHYVVGQDGAIVQCVREQDGAGGNCCLEGGHDSFWPTDINLNLVTFSIESVDPTLDNSSPMPQAQKSALFSLVKDICTRNSIPMRPADSNGGIAGHNSIAPQSRARCPGNFPWTDLWLFLKGSSVMLPSGWVDDGTTLKCNGYVVVKGFRDYVLQRLLDGTWRGDDIPVENEQSVKQLEQSNPGLGGGSRQRFRYSTLEWTQDRGVFQAYTGPELIKLEQLLILANAQIQQLQKQQPAPPLPAPPPLPANISQAVQAINAIGVMAEQLKSDGDTIAQAVKNALTALGK